MPDEMPTEITFDKFIEMMRAGLDRYIENTKLFQSDVMPAEQRLASEMTEEEWWENFQSYVEDFGIEGNIADDEDES